MLEWSGCSLPHITTTTTKPCSCSISKTGRGMIERHKDHPVTKHLCLVEYFTQLCHVPANQFQEFGYPLSCQSLQVKCSNSSDENQNAIECSSLNLSCTKNARPKQRSLHSCSCCSVPLSHLVLTPFALSDELLGGLFLLAAANAAPADKGGRLELAL